MTGDAYAGISHNSQGATADRVLVQVETKQAHEKLIDSLLAYVSVSRGRYDAEIYACSAGNDRRCGRHFASQLPGSDRLPRYPSCFLRFRTYTVYNKHIGV
jgi:hypothetical protein